MDSPSSKPEAHQEKPVKPPKPEDKPFDEFINQDFIPTLTQALSNKGVKQVKISLENGERPVTGGKCWMIIGELPNGRRFWLCFDSNKISSSKVVALAEYPGEPSVIESFLIDERKITLALLTSRLMQRLNGQKWLSSN